MSEPFIAQIVMFGGNFAPRNWALCDGQLLQISQFTALFSILGTTYGGDGRTTFALPELRGRVAVHAGSGPGLTQRRLGEKGGAETVTLTTQQIPSHTHNPHCNSNPGDETNPVGGFPSNAATAGDIYNTGANADMGAGSATGGGQSHNNLQPFTAVNFIIALVGVFPS